MWLPEVVNPEAVMRPGFAVTGKIISPHQTSDICPKKVVKHGSHSRRLQHTLEMTQNITFSTIGMEGGSQLPFFVLFICPNTFCIIIKSLHEIISGLCV